MLPKKTCRRVLALPLRHVEAWHPPAPFTVRDLVRFGGTLRGRNRCHRTRGPRGAARGGERMTTIRIEADGSMKLIAAGDVGHVPPNLRTGATGDPERTLALPD